LRELGQALDAISCDDTARAVILTGAGGKAFVAGADIAEFQAFSPRQAEAYALEGQAVFSRIEQLNRPVIAAVNGYALGGGCELAMACTLRVASRTATFGQPEVRLGLVPGFGGSQRLPRLIGRGRALEMLLTGEAISAQRALEVGLIEQVVEPDVLMAAAEALARRIIANGPAAVAQCLKAVNEGLDSPLPEGLSLEARLFGECFDTEEMKTRTRAFLDKARK
jgi:enoyl-CoA hydratase